ncbi:hypothetical protein ANN_25965 [Periplaneta americana]|uniref:Uncharacterized protein n=1 Tax=Periplaneta americana TaxID=6978 RepID=A0ABQ8S4M1_PERAM|nr:hypothetical protein ANN_25965 [Periplaneta americana]
MDYKTIKRLHANLIRTGSVTQQKGAGRPKTVITGETKAANIEAFQRSPKKSIRQYQRESGVSYEDGQWNDRSLWWTGEATAEKWIAELRRKSVPLKYEIVILYSKNLKMIKDVEEHGNRLNQEVQDFKYIREKFPKLRCQSQGSCGDQYEHEEDSITIFLSYGTKISGPLNETMLADYCCLCVGMLRNSQEEAKRRRSHGATHDSLQTQPSARLFSLDGIDDSEMIFGEMRLRIRHRLHDIRLTIGKNLGKNLNQTSKWADNRQATNFECTLTPYDLNCGFLLTNSDVYYANQDFRYNVSTIIRTPRSELA